MSRHQSVKEMFSQNNVSDHNCAWGGTAGRKSLFHTGKQESVDSSVCVCVWASSHPAHPEYLATALAVSLDVDTHTETLKSKQLHKDFLILCYCIETMIVLQSSYWGSVYTDYSLHAGFFVNASKSLSHNAC